MYRQFLHYLLLVMIRRLHRQHHHLHLLLQVQKLLGMELTNKIFRGHQKVVYLYLDFQMAMSFHRGHIFQILS
jgi:hypothetical protein